VELLELLMKEGMGRGMVGMVDQRRMVHHHLGVCVGIEVGRSGGEGEGGGGGGGGGGGAQRLLWWVCGVMVGRVMGGGNHPHFHG
jgi:hypothetical protein